MARLPVPGGDDGTWGTVLNDYLDVAHDTDGTLKAGTVGTSQLQSGAVTQTKLANGAIDDSKIAAGAGIAQSKIANLSGDLAAKYTKPASGIPSSDLDAAAQTSLNKATAAYQKPAGGIPSSDMSSAVQTSLANADSAYQKPSGGVPETDLDSGVQTKLNALGGGSFITGDGIAQVTVSATAPTNPAVGDVWIAT